MGKKSKKSQYEVNQNIDPRLAWLISKLERASDTALDIICQIVQGLLGE